MLPALGTIIVDWLDEDALHDLAEQLRLPFALESRQVEVEGKTQKMTPAPQVMGFSAGSAEWEKSAEETSERRYGPEASAVRLRRAIEKLVIDNQVADFLLGAYEFELSGRRSIDTAIGFDRVVLFEDADEAEKITTKLDFSSALAQRCSEAFRDRDWFLLEAYWNVVRDGDIVLQFHGVAPVWNVVELDELEIDVQLDVAQPSALRQPARRFQSGRLVRATVFGSVANADEDKERWRISVDPIAVFDRKAGNPSFSWDRDRLLPEGYARQR
jgi:hypothetical protein